VHSSTVETSAARLGAALRDGGLGTERISERVDSSRLEAYALVLYLPLDTRRGMLQTAASEEDLLGSVARTPTLDRLLDGVNHRILAHEDMLPTLRVAAGVPDTTRRS
jgi:hypothetical protein